MGTYIASELKIVQYCDTINKSVVSAVHPAQIMEGRYRLTRHTESSRIKKNAEVRC